MRQAREVVPNVPHHVFTRGNNRRRLFSYPSDYRRMLHNIESALDAFRCLIHALVLMTNHLHLIVVPSSKETLGDFMKAICQRYAQYRNHRRESSGKLFEARYSSVIIQDDEQLAITTAYVELNPVRAGMVQNPGDYPWSSYRLHAGAPRQSRIPSRIITPSDWYLGLSCDPDKRRQLYAEFVAQCRDRDIRPDGIEEIRRKEDEAQRPYTLRLERPNRIRARETVPRYPRSK